jgi:hypothetical protein
MVTRTGLAPVNTRVKGVRVRLLHQRAELNFYKFLQLVDT